MIRQEDGHTNGEQVKELEEILRLVKQLKNDRNFGRARKKLAQARQAEIADSSLRLKFAQQHALCTYKDPGLPVYSRLDEALEILKEVEDLDKTKDQETLGITGAIHKRKWEANAEKRHLERSLHYYRRGYDEGVANDFGYTGINTAFVLDLLANQELDEVQIKARHDEAKKIRQDLVTTLEPMVNDPDKAWLEKEWWFLVTMAEAYFGLEKYKEAGDWLKKAAKLDDVPTWEFETTARQLASLARLQGVSTDSRVDFERSKAGQVLLEFLGNVAGVFTAFVGKVGLALSGGGFRASLFHIGVLAKLAELDILRHVEVLSCVSGGSIIGAHYYLEVRKLLQEKRDSEITREDYIDIVNRIASDFMDGVQQNIRTRVAAEFLTNLKMIIKPSYSRTQRVGELYEKIIYSKVKDGGQNAPRYLDDLLVKPAGETAGFAPKHDNWRREAKVPILILNATTLNTCHNWQFTATWMGETPMSIDPQIDGNYRLRRMWYWEAPEPYRKIRLGHAVAASSCVPGLFEPLALDGLYPDRVVRLVDGGVHDNQGIVGLLEQDCTVILVSDASGQNESQDNPSSGLLGVSLRSNNILMARVREAQYHDLQNLRRASLLRGLMFVHLKKDLDEGSVNWLGYKDPDEDLNQARRTASEDPLTYYQIPKEIQKCLASIRTDLDSFNEAEAKALMLSGYLMTEHDFNKDIQGFPQPPTVQSEWPFLDIKTYLTPGTPQAKNLTQLLDVARNRAFKIWHLSRWLQISTIIIGIVVLIGLVWACWTWWSTPVLTVGMIGAAIAIVVALLVIGQILGGLTKYSQIFVRIAIGFVMALVGWIAVRIHLLIFDRWYLRRGRLTRHA